MKISISSYKLSHAEAPHVEAPVKTSPATSKHRVFKTEYFSVSHTFSTRTGRYSRTSIINSYKFV